MTDDYPTDARVLFTYSDEDWTELLTRLESARLPLPRMLVVLDRRPRPQGIIVKHHRAKLYPSDVIEIQTALASGKKVKDIAHAYGVSRQRVHQIKVGMGP